MHTPHHIEFDAHKRGLRLAHHLMLQRARQRVCDHRWTGVLLGGVRCLTDCLLVRDRVARARQGPRGFGDMIPQVLARG